MSTRVFQSSAHFDNAPRETANNHQLQRFLWYEQHLMLMHFFFFFLSTYSIFIFLTPVIELYLNISVYQSQHKLLLPIVIHNQIKNLPISVYLCLLFRLNPNTHTSFCLSRGISVLLIICNVRNIWFGLFDETCHASRSDHFHHSAH